MELVETLSCKILTISIREFSEIFTDVHNWKEETRRRNDLPALIGRLDLSRGRSVFRCPVSIGVAFEFARKQLILSRRWV